MRGPRTKRAAAALGDRASAGDTRQALVGESRAFAAASLHAGAGARARARPARRVAGRLRGATGAEGGNAAVGRAGAGRNRSDCAQPRRADGRTARAHLATQRNRCAAPDHHRGPRTRRGFGEGTRRHARGDVPGRAPASAVGLARPHGRRARARRMAHAGAGHSVVCLGLRDCGGHCTEIWTHRCDHDHRLRGPCGSHARRVAGGLAARRVPGTTAASRRDARPGAGGQRSGCAG